MGKTAFTFVAAVVGAAGLPACGGGSTGSSGTPAAPSGSAAATTTAGATTVPATAAPATTAPPAPTTTNFGAAVVGTVLGAAGTTLVPPSSPTVKPYSPACQSLLDPDFSGQCLVVAAPSGTIAAVVEMQSSGEQATAQERDLVYAKTAAGWNLALRRVLTTDGPTTQLAESDIMRDGDPKAVFAVRSANSEYANELDVVEGDGKVTLYRQLHGGFATVVSSGGLETFVPSAAPVNGYDQAIVTYTGGVWKLISDQEVSQTQAQAEASEPYDDPQGTPAMYYS